MELNATPRETVPALVLPFNVLPGELLSIHLFEPAHLKFVEQQLSNRQSEGSVVFAAILDLDGTPSPTACLATIEEILQQHEDGSLDLLIRGIDPVQIVEDFPKQNCGQVRILRQRTFNEKSTDQLYQLYQLIRATAHEVGQSLDVPFEEVNSSWEIAASLFLDILERQELLVTNSENTRIELLNDFVGFRKRMIELCPHSLLQMEVSELIH